MVADLRYLEGRKFCLVFMAGAAPDAAKVQLRCLHGRASVDRQGVLAIEHAAGRFLVPSSCYPNILPSDGSPLLGEAEYYTICRVAGLPL